MRQNNGVHCSASEAHQRCIIHQINDGDHYITINVIIIIIIVVITRHYKRSGFLHTHTHTHKLGERAFSYAGPVVWNNLPVYIRTEPDITRFKNIRF